MKQQIPESITGYALEPINGYFTFIAPEDSENECGNPSVELNLDGYSANGAGAAITRTVEWQSRGAFGIKVTVPGTNTGVKYSLTTSTGSYAFSFDFQGVRGYEYACGIFLQADWSVVSRRRFYASGEIERVSCTGICAADAYYFIIVQMTDKANSFYTDGWQIENKSYPTTYIDGDLKGFMRNKTEYYWVGKPHLSASVRLSTTRSGGREYKLSDLGVQVTGYAGLGIVPVVNNYSEISGGGAYYHNSIYKLRRLVITGSLFGTGTAKSINKKLSEIIDIIKPSVVPIKQPMLIRYHSLDNCGQSDGHVYNIVCTYVGGLEASIDNLYQHNLALEFEQYDIYLEKDFDSAIAIMEQVAYTAVGNIFRRDYSGHWESMGLITYPTAPLTKSANLFRSEDKVLYAFGQFDDIGGVTCYNIAYYSTSGWTAFGNGGNYGTDDEVYDIEVIGTSVYAVGDFENVAGGTVAASKIARYEQLYATWYPVIAAAAFDASIFSCCYDPAKNRLYIGGDFETIGGVAYGNIAAINLTTNTLVANFGNLNGAVQTVLYRNNKLYVFGFFTDADGVTGASYAVVYDPRTDTWAALGNASTVFATTYPVTPTFDTYGNLFAIKFSTKEIYRYNGTIWVLAEEPARVVGQEYHLIIGSDSSGNIFTDSLSDNVIESYPIHKYAPRSHLTVEDFGRKLVNNWTHGGPISYFVPSNAEMEEAYFSFTEDCYLFNNWRTIDVDSEELVYPKIEIYGPMNISSIKNFTTSQSINFNTLSSISNRIGFMEKVTLDFRGNAFKMESSARQNSNDLLTQSTSYDFHFNMGTNYITCNFYNNYEVVTDWDEQINSLLNLTGIDFDNTTNGTFYVSVVDKGGGDFQIEIYSDATKSALVGHSDVYAAADSTLTINPDNASGLGGTIDVDNPVANADMRWKFGYILIYMNTNFISVR